MDSWIIGDGNYADFSEGETRQFALEFWAPSQLSVVQNQEKSITENAQYLYQVNARVVYSSADILVIDFGLLAYSEASAELEIGLATGDFVTGDIRLGVDPFFYFERLSKVHGVPPLIYEWRIESIQQETTPMVVGEVCGRPGYVKDASRTSFAKVKSTEDVIPNANDIAPSYVLQCTKLETAPMTQFSRPQR